MRYLRWKLSHDVWGTYPVEAIGALGGRAEPSGCLDSDGYRIAYLYEDADISQLDPVWDTTEVTEAEALAFAQLIDPDIEVLSNGKLDNPAHQPNMPN
tara:strand:+ start:1029 stop:1322 length:294 start_codon:yes stop_codon:yes gene_type:complete